MLMGLVVLLLVAGVAYFHFVQGFFSATLSAIFAIVAAVASFGFHEWIVRNFAATYLPELAGPLVLVLLFAIIYTVLRVVFDQYVPGNVTFPLMIDRIGGAAMGVVAGVFAAGVLVIAAQSLPFGPAIGGYARFAVASDPIEAKVPKVPGELTVVELLKSENLSPAEESHLLIPVDDIVVNTTAHLSEGGSLAGPVGVSAVHPAYLNELFFQRLGLQTAAKHVAINQPGKEVQVEVKGMFSPMPTDPLPQADGEISGFPSHTPPTPLFTDPANTLVILRTVIQGGAVDKDNRVRLSPASVRLVIKGKNFMPIGTLDMTTAVQLRRNRPDDFIVMDGGGTVDLAFLIPVDGDYLVPTDSKGKVKTDPFKLANGSFLEVKRFGDVEITQVAKRERPPLLPEKTGQVLRKKELPQSKNAVPNVPATPTPAGGGAAAAIPSGDAPFEYGSKLISEQLQSPVNVGAHDGDSGDVTFPSGSATLTDGKFAKFDVKPAVSIAQLGQGDSQITYFWTDPGMKVVQVVGTPSNANPWEWADKLGQFELVDNAGKSYKARGAWVHVKMTSGTFEDRIAAKYDATADVPKFDHVDARPTDVRLIFIIIANAQPQSLKFGGKLLASVN